MKEYLSTLSFLGACLIPFMIAAIPLAIAILTNAWYWFRVWFSRFHWDQLYSLNGLIG